MKYLSTINMSSNELKKQLKFLSIKVGCKQNIEVEKWGTGFFVELDLDQKTELFFITAKQNIHNKSLDFVYPKMVWELNTINLKNREINDEPRQFDIDLTKQRIYINEDFIVFHCTSFIDQINNELFKNNEVLYFLVVNYLNLLPNPKVIKNTVDLLDLNLFTPIYLVGYLTHNYEIRTTNLVIKKSEISSEIDSKIDDNDLFLVDSGLTKLSYGSLVIKFNNGDGRLNHIILGILVDFETIEVNINDKYIELPNGYCRILSIYKIIDYIFNVVLIN